MFEKKSQTLFSILDNFFSSKNATEQQIMCLSEERIIELANLVMNFYSTYRLPEKKHGEYRAFLGSFVSANFGLVEHNQYLLNSLLYCHSVFLPCPLHSWFCEERNDFPHAFHVQYTPWLCGFYLPSNNGELSPINYEGTKLYLRYILPSLYAIRPLVEKNLIHLFPYHWYALLDEEALKILPQTLMQSKKVSFEYVTKKFRPYELSIDESKRGLFVIPSSEPEKYINEHIHASIEFYARDLISSINAGLTYTASSRWDYHLSKIAINEQIEGVACGRTAVVEAIYNSEIPYLNGTNISKVLQIHEMKEFVEFREQLYSWYRELEPVLYSGEFEIRKKEIEEDIIMPRVNNINKILNTSIFTKVLNVSKQASLSFAEGYAVGLAAKLDEISPAALKTIAITAGGASVVKSIIGYYKNRLQGVDRVWAALMKKDGLTPLIGNDKEYYHLRQPHGGWFSENKNPLSVYITEGEILKAFLNDGTVAKYIQK